MKAILQTKKSKDYRNNIKVLLNNSPHRLQVEFALYCATDALININPTKEPKLYEVSKKCLVLVEAWLVDANSVSKEELREAAYAPAAYSAASAPASYAAYSAAYAYDAYSAAASATKTTYAYSATYSAAYAYDAYSAATQSFGPQNEIKLKAYYEWLFDKLTEGMNKGTLEVLYGE